MKGTKRMQNYKLNTYANGLGVWQCAITYPEGLGNSGEAERIIANSMSAARRSIRKAITERNAQPVRRLRYSVLSNDYCSVNHLHGLVITEA
jgi:hypothetical protein